MSSQEKEITSPRAEADSLSFVRLNPPSGLVSESKDNQDRVSHLENNNGPEHTEHAVLASLPNNPTDLVNDNTNEISADEVMKLLRSELEGGREERREIMKLLRSELEGAREERELHAVMELLRPELEGGRKERLRFVFIIALLVLLLSLLPGRTEYLH